MKKSFRRFLLLCQKTGEGSGPFSRITVSFLIFLPNEIQALEEQRFVRGDAVSAIGADARAHAARGDDARGFFAKRLGKSVQKTVDRTGSAVHDAGFHAVHGVCRDYVARRQNLNARQKRGFLCQGVQGNPHAGQDRAADVFSALVHDGQRGCRSHVHDHNGEGIFLLRSHRGGNEIRGDGSGVVDRNVKPRFDARADDQRLFFGDRAHSAHQNVGQGRNHTGNDRARKRRAVDLVQFQNLFDLDRVSHIGLHAVGGDAADRAETAHAVGTSEGDVRISAINGEDHDVLLFCLFRGKIFFSDAHNVSDRGTENGIDGKFQNEVEADQNHQNIRHGVVTEVGQRPLLDGVHEEGQTAEEKDARIDDGADHSREDRRHHAVFLLQKLEDQARGNACQDSFGEYGDDGSGDTDDHKCGGISRQQHGKTKHQSEPRARADTVNCGTDDDGDQGECDRKGGESQRHADKLQNDNSRAEQSDSRDRLDPLFVGFHIQFSFCYCFGQAEYSAEPL